MASTSAAKSIPSRWKAIDADADADEDGGVGGGGRGGREEVAAAAVAAGRGADDADGGGGGDDDGVDGAEAAEESVELEAPYLAGGGTVIATGAAFPSALFFKNPFQQLGYLASPTTSTVSLLLLLLLLLLPPRQRRRDDCSY